MAKKSTVFFCKECGFESAKWMGQCPSCHAWNSFVEEPVKTIQAPSGASKGRRSGAAKAVSLKDVSLEEHSRMSSGMKELDRVLGGGIVPGSLILVGGDPGIGKSTILLQVLSFLSGKGHKSLYVSGEESLQQIKMRAVRLGGPNEEVRLASETNLTDIEALIDEEQPEVLVIDSIQTMFREDITSAPGSVSQVRESTAVFMQIAKSRKISIFLVGHVTKEGMVAGPRVLEHMVDTVLYFEGERSANYRIIRAVKNRFGATNEVGVFEMGNEGLKEVENPSEYMLSGRPLGASGSVVTCVMEGTRPLLLELQALVSRTAFGLPRRTAAGIDYNRVNLLIAVLEKRASLSLGEYDVYVNLTGGMRITEPSLDLAVVAAIISGFYDIPVKENVAVFGETGLAGEIRAVSQTSLRVKEAVKLGYTKIIIPAVSLKEVEAPYKAYVTGVKDVRELVRVISKG